MEFWLACFGVFTTVVGGIWTAYVYFDKKKSSSLDKPPGKHVASHGGVASGRDTVIHGNVTLSQLPKTSLAIITLGLLILLWAIMRIGDSTTNYTVTNYSFANPDLFTTPSQLELVDQSVSKFANSGPGNVVDVSLSELEGLWSSRWRRDDTEWFEGSAIASLTDDGIQFMYVDKTGQYDLQAKLVKKGVLSGHYHNLGAPEDNADWVGFVTERNNIKGFYNGGIWDFSRP